MRNASRTWAWLCRGFFTCGLGVILLGSLWPGDAHAAHLLTEEFLRPAGVSRIWTIENLKQVLYSGSGWLEADSFSYPAATRGSATLNVGFDLSAATSAAYVDIFCSTRQAQLVLEVSTTTDTWVPLSTLYCAASPTKLPLTSLLGQRNVRFRLRWEKAGSLFDATVFWFHVDDGSTGVKLTEPAPAGAFRPGTTQNVAWDFTGPVSGAATLDISLSSDGGATFTSLSSGLPLSGGNINWVVAGGEAPVAILRAQVLDAAGKTLALDYVDYPLHVDATAPAQAAPTSPMNGACVGARPTFEWTWPPDTAKQSVTLTGAGGEKRDVPGVFTNYLTLPEAQALTEAGNPWVWQVHTFDSAGNESISVARSINVDTTPDQPFDLQAPADGDFFKPGSTKLMWSESAAAGCSARLYYAVFGDGVECIRIYPGQARETTLSSFPSGCPLEVDGNHRWTVFAVDAAGNRREASPSGGWRLTTDKTPPGKPVMIFPATSFATTRSTPMFTWHPVQDVGSGGIKYRMSIDGTAVGDPFATTSWQPVVPLSSGLHTWKLEAIDLAGNTSETTGQIRIDDNPPDAFAAVIDPVCTNLPTPSLCWLRPTDMSGIAGYDLWIDGALAVANISPSSTCSTPPGALGLGKHPWHVIARDLAGNIRQSETAHAYIDRAAPTAATLAEPPAGADLSTLRPAFTWSAATDDAGIMGYEILLDGQVIGTASAEATSWTPIADLTAGTHQWTVRAVDHCKAAAPLPAARPLSVHPCAIAQQEACGSETGTCRPGMRVCTNERTWGSCMGTVGPVAEVCGDGLDNDCNGTPDNGCPASVDAGVVDGGPIVADAQAATEGQPAFPDAALGQGGAGGSVVSGAPGAGSGGRGGAASGGNNSGGAGGQGGNAAPPTDDEPTMKSASGCGCRVGEVDDAPAGISLACLLMLVLGRRRARPGERNTDNGRKQS